MFIEGWTDKNGDSITFQPMGMFTSPDGEEWSSTPYTKEQRTAYVANNRFHHTLDKVKKHLARTDRGIVDEIALIKAKKSTLPRYCKDWMLKLDE